MFDDPFKDFEKLRKEIDAVFDRLTSNSFNFPDIKHYLNDIEDKEKEIVITVNLPCVDRKDIDLIITENFVEVKARRKSEVEIKKKGFYKQEKSCSGIHKLIPLPSNIDINRVQAEFKNDVLTIRIPKKTAKVEQKKAKKLVVRPI